MTRPDRQRASLPARKSPIPRWLLNNADVITVLCLIVLFAIAPLFWRAP